MYARGPLERLRDAVLDPEHRSALVGIGLLVLVVVLGARRCTSFPERPDVDAPPVQEATEHPPFDHGPWTLHPRATFDVEGVVVSTHRYWFDGGAKLSRWDVGLAWGRTAWADVLDEVRWTHHTRFLHWRTSRELAVSFEQMEREIANIHTIAATPDVERSLRRLRRGEIARLQGLLVDVRGANAFVWNTSLTRTDTGNGACEILWVQSVSVRPAPRR
jgi:hypothetical protein